VRFDGPADVNKEEKMSSGPMIIVMSLISL
jgi:hypothetical protein